MQEDIKKKIIINYIIINYFLPLIRNVSYSEKAKLEEYF